MCCVSLLFSVLLAVEQGAHVINMSLGGPNYLETSKNYFDEIKNSGTTLIIAAAGNDGSSDFLYPASYSSVSVITVL